MMKLTKYESIKKLTERFTRLKILKRFSDMTDIEYNEKVESLKNELQAIRER